MIPTPVIECGRIPRIADIQAMSNDLAAAARRVHAEWDQDVDGHDEVFGYGGICQDVATGMVDTLVAAGFDNALTVHGTTGENHVWVVALCGDGVYAIDIPPSVYEIGSGFVWRKRRDAVITGDEVTFLRICDTMDAEAFENAFGEG